MAKLIYILAASHSGSTLLAMLLGAQERVFTAGELKASGLGSCEAYRCSCRRMISECGFWREMETRMAERGVPGFAITDAGTDVMGFKSVAGRRLLAPLHRGRLPEIMRDSLLRLTPGWSGFLAECQRRNLALIESVAEASGADWIVDSSKTGLRLKYLMRLPGLEVRVVRLIRDGRAVALSYTNEWEYADATEPGMRGGGGGGGRQAGGRSISEAAREWRRSNEEAEAITRALPHGQWAEVRYERLCQDPRRVLKRLGAWLGLCWDEVTLDFRNSGHHVIGNGMRLDDSARIVADERWRQHLGGSDIESFDRVAGDLNRRYGYA